MSVGVACGGTTWAEVADASQAVADAAADALNHFARADTVTAATSVAVVGSLITLNQVTGMLSAAVLNASSSDIRGVFSVVRFRAMSPPRPGWQILSAATLSSCSGGLSRQFAVFRSTPLASSRLSLSWMAHSWAGAPPLAQ